jgi:hypothetical protein
MNNINKATPIPNRLNINSTDTSNNNYYVNEINNVIQSEENSISVNSFQAIAAYLPQKWDVLPPF